MTPTEMAAMIFGPRPCDWCGEEQSNMLDRYAHSVLHHPREVTQAMDDPTFHVEAEAAAAVGYLKMVGRYPGVA